MKRDTKGVLGTSSYQIKVQVRTLKFPFFVDASHYIAWLLVGSWRRLNDGLIDSVKSVERQAASGKRQAWNNE
jgi:hypothetical protein